MKLQMKLFSRIAILFCLALVAFASVLPAVAADEAVITYRKVFKGSTPESVELIIRETGKCTYDIRQLAEDPKATEFEISPSIREKIFSLAKKDPELFPQSGFGYASKNRQPRRENFSVRKRRRRKRSHVQLHRQHTRQSVAANL